MKSLRFCLAALTLSAGCERDTAPAPAPGKAEPRVSPSAPELPATVVPDAPRAPIPLEEFARLVTELSEPDSDFITDNYVSNETSYLQVAQTLERRTEHDGVYIGVGPEQNFTYIGLTEPALAFIVDIRRANLVLHLLYKSLFELAESREQFLALLFSRPFPHPPSSPETPIHRLLARVRERPPSEAAFATTHAAILERITRVHGIELSPADRKQLERTERAFFERQLELAFELKHHSSRRYPTFAELVAATDANGDARGFLGSEDAYARVARLQRENRIVPIVGDFAGNHALLGIAREVRRRGLTTSVFYVSNVEQYLLGDAQTWQRWLRNLRELPADAQTLLVRAYLDQGRRHPAQHPGQRTATVVQQLARSLERGQRPPRDLWQLTTQDTLDDPHHR